MEKYIPIKETSNATHLKVRTYYSLGGSNMLTYTAERRGYYLSVSPVRRFKLDGGVEMESYVAFTGTKMLLKEVARKSKKAEAEAEQIAAEKMDDLVRYVCEENGLVLLDS